MGRVQAPITTVATCPWLACFSRALTRTGSFQHLWRASVQPLPVRSGRRLFPTSQAPRWRSFCHSNTLRLTGHHQTPANASSPTVHAPFFVPARFHSTNSRLAPFQDPLHHLPPRGSKGHASLTLQRSPSQADKARSRHWRLHTRRRPTASSTIQASVISHHRLGRKFRRFCALKRQDSHSRQRSGGSSSKERWDPQHGQLMNRETRLLLHQFEVTLQRRDVRHAYDQYLFLRQQTRGQLRIDGTPFFNSRLWMDLQLNFLRLLYIHEHQTVVRASSLTPASLATGPLRYFLWSSSPSAPSQKLPGRVHKSITEIQRRQNRLYEDMLVTTFRDYPGSASLTRSLAQSLAVLGRTDEKGGATKKDWREALRPLEEWSRLYRQLDMSGEASSSSIHTPTPASSLSTHAPTSASTKIHPHLAKRLEQQLELLMKKLVYTHTALISQLFDHVEMRFGIPPTFSMHMTLLRYYARFGYREGSTEALRIVKSMNDRQLPWQEDTDVYDLLLSSMSRRAGWRDEIRLLVDTMLNNGILPKEETMHAAMLCAARSGDVMTCSRYLDRMHREWGLSPSERLKSILLYACAKRGDFQGAVEVFGQLLDRGHITQIGSRPGRLNATASKDDPAIHPATLSVEESTEAAQGDLDNALMNQSNLLLALINQSTAASKGRRRDHRQDRAMIQEEVRSILQLFSMVAHPSHHTTTRVDSHLYTILMQYLSTLPSPLQGMRHLYEEMLKKPETKPNLVTYKILLDACAEEMDMRAGQEFWNNMLNQGFLPNKHVHASYVKGWCRVGEFEKAEAVCREAHQIFLGVSDGVVQQAREALRRQIQMRSQTLLNSSSGSMASSNNRRAIRAIQKRLMNERMVSRQLARQQMEAFDISVVDALMQGYARHDMWHQACRVYESIEQGRWGNTIHPTPKALATFFYCCSQGGFVERAIDTFSRIEGRMSNSMASFKTLRKKNLSSYGSGDARDDANTPGSEPTSEAPLANTEWADLLTDGVFFHYFGVLGHSHRAELLVPTWRSLLQVGIYPSQRTVARLLDCLEDHQWGLSAIKQVQLDLESNWPDQDWSSIIGDRSGGRLWK